MHECLCADNILSIAGVSSIYTGDYNNSSNFDQTLDLKNYYIPIYGNEQWGSSGVLQVTCSRPIDIFSNPGVREIVDVQILSGGSGFGLGTNSPRVDISKHLVVPSDHINIIPDVIFTTAPITLELTLSKEKNSNDVLRITDPHDDAFWLTMSISKISKLRNREKVPDNVSNTVHNLINVSGQHMFKKNDPVYLSVSDGGVLPKGLEISKQYYISSTDGGLSKNRNALLPCITQNTRLNPGVVKNVPIVAGETPYSIAGSWAKGSRYIDVHGIQKRLRLKTFKYKTQRLHIIHQN